MKLVLEAHGATWKDDDHLGKSSTPCGTSFIRAPATLGGDVSLVKEGLEKLRKDGISVGLTQGEIEGLRWHGAKASLSSVMQHLGLKEKVVRFQGGWKDRAETMPDTYLREAQTLLLESQLKCIVYLREGGDLVRLEGVPVDKSPQVEMDEVEKARRAKAMSACVLPALLAARVPMDLLDSGFDAAGQIAEERLLHEKTIFRDGDDWSECLADAEEPVVELKQEKETDAAEGAEVKDALKDDDLERVMDELDTEGLTAFWVHAKSPSAKPLMHLPAPHCLVGETIVDPAPKCGIAGSFTHSIAEDALDFAATLCRRCCTSGTERACRLPVKRQGRGARAEGASIPAAFRKSAVQFGVAESDFLLMNNMGIYTHEGLALRVHSKEALEEYLQEVICPSAAYADPVRGLITFNRTPPVPWQEFKRSEDVASIRKLWLLSKELCKSELESLASGESSGKSKVTLTAAVTMEQDAVSRGMPAPVSDSERPSLYTLSKMVKSFVGPGAAYEYLSWETFLSQEEQDRMERTGVMPKTKNELVLSKDRAVIQEKDRDDPPVAATSGMEVMRKRLELRARAACMVGLAQYGTYRALHDRFCSKLLGEVPEGMRPPTSQEVRRFDRTLHQEVLRWLSRGVGTMDDGIGYYLTHEEQGIWRLLDAVVGGLPDQGIDKQASSSRPEKKQRRDHEEEEDDRDASPLKRKPHLNQPKRKKQCLVCKKRHYPFCKMTKEHRREMKLKGQAKRKAEREKERHQKEGKEAK
eukprot:s2693_g2.t1